MLWTCWPRLDLSEGTITKRNLQEIFLNIFCISKNIRGLYIAVSYRGNERDGGITQNGFRFLLMDTPSQVWRFVLSYLQTTQKWNMDLIECISFIFQLSFSQIGKVRIYFRFLSRTFVSRVLYECGFSCSIIRLVGSPITR